MSLDSLLVCVVNYDLNDNAERLKDYFSAFCDSVLIDSSSPMPPKNADIIVENNYYPGLWNCSVENSLIRGKKWLLFVASDVELRNKQLIMLKIRRAMKRADIGVYSPSLEVGSRSSYAECIFSNTRSIRSVPFIEGFFFLARTSLLSMIYPIPKSNTYGWGVDAVMCHTARKFGLKVVVDDRVLIFHPKRRLEHQIDEFAAAKLAHLQLGGELRDWISVNYRFRN